MRDRTVGDAVAEVATALGRERFDGITALVNRGKDWDLATLRGVVEASDAGVLPALVQGLSPVGTVGAECDRIAERLGPARAPLAFEIAHLVEHLDLAGLLTVRAVAESELARAQSPNKSGVN
jgi:hypothetical protein